MQLTPLYTSPNQVLNSWGWKWLLGTDTLPYIHSDLVQVSESEAQAYVEAGNTLYEMYIEAAEYVIANKLYAGLGIAPALIPLIEYSWAHDNHWHIYGRFDLAGGIDGQPIKLIEFNADTATCIPETALVQWASLQANNLQNEKQVNNLYECLKSQFEELRLQNPHLEPFMLFSTMEGYPEDEANVAILAEAAKEAGFEIAFEYIENVEFSAQEGIFRQVPATGQFEKFGFWFKLMPWEYIAEDEPELCEILSKLVLSGQVVVLNPAYTLLFQSKAMLAILWQLYPNHPLLLESSTDRIIGKKCVEKVLFGREGANVKILNEYGRELEESPGEYGQQATVFQEFVELPNDAQGRKYQAGLFFAGEACALGYRLGGTIIDNRSQFCGHVVV